MNKQQQTKLKAWPQRLFCAPWSGGVIIGLLAWLMVVGTIDPSGSYPRLAEGPGITIDESFNVQQGILLVEAIRAYGIFIIDPITVREVFGGEGGVPYLPDHPPLGRLLLGMAHHLWWSWFPPSEPGSVDVTAAARTGSALLFALTVFLVGATTGTWFGGIAGWTASLSLLLMPRLFGHAHLASLETSVNLFVSLAVLCTAHHWSRRMSLTQQLLSDSSEADARFPRTSWTVGILPGIYLGLAMLTKIQGFLTIPVIIVWGLCYGGRRMLVPLVVWGIVANMVFFLGWPWLWLDPLRHLQEFLGSATDRAHLSVWYLGERFRDVDVPWHYPWVMTVVTIPVGILFLGLVGIWQTIQDRCRDQRMTLLLGSLVFPLILFSSRVAVYDGSRLFLIVFPLWAVFSGQGGGIAWKWLTDRIAFPKVVMISVLFLIMQSVGLLATHPYSLSYYNLLVGGPAGAARLGFESTYWQDSLTRSFWRDCAEVIPEGATVHVAPTLHQFQLADLRNQIPKIRQQEWNLVEINDQNLQQVPEYLIIFERQADLQKMEFLSEMTPVVTREVSGNGFVPGVTVSTLWVR